MPDKDDLPEVLADRRGGAGGPRGRGDSAAGRRLGLLFLAVVLLAGGAARLLYFLEIRGEPEYRHPQVDASFHDYWARALVTGDWTPPPDREDPLIRESPYLRPPGYPAFLAGVYRLFGPGYDAPRIVQFLLGLCSCLVGFAVARRRFGTGTALVFAGFMGTYWPFIYFEGELLAPALLVFLGMVLIALLDSWTERITPFRALAAGVVLGLLALVRPTILPFGASAPLWAWSLDDRRRRGTGRWLAVMALYGLGALAVILPVTARNFAVGGEFFLVSSSGGVNLYIGNNPAADGLVTARLPGAGNFGTCFDYRGVVRSIERAAGRKVSHGDVSRHFHDLALRFVRENPALALSLALKKTLLFWGPREVSHNRENEIVREKSPVLSRLPVGFAAVLALAVTGALLFVLEGRGAVGAEDAARPAQKNLLLLAALQAVLTFLTHLPFFVAARYRVVVVPGLMLAGAFGAWRIGAMAFGRRRGAAALWAAGGLLLYGVFSGNPTGYRPDYGRWNFARALTLSREGDAAGARSHYEETLRVDPGFSFAHTNLALLLMGEGDLGGAEGHLRAAAAANDGDPVVHYDLGLVLSRQGRREEAKEEYRRALAWNPDFADAHSGMGDELLAEGDVAGAAAHYAEAAAIRRDTRAMLMVAASLDLAGLPAEAREYYRRAREMTGGGERRGVVSRGTGP